MSDGIEAFLAVTTGPAVLRSRLRGATGRIRRSPRLLAGVRGVRSVFPDDLLGGDLLAVLGPHLRALLEAIAVGEAEPALSGRTWRRAGWGLAGQTDVPGAPPFPTTARGRARPPVAAADGGRTGLTRLDLGEDPTSASAVYHASGAVTLPRTRVAGASVLEQRVRRYWQAVAAAERRAAGGPLGEGAPGGRERSGLAPPASAGSRRDAPSEVELAQDLEAFVSGRSVSGRPRRWAGGPPGDGDGQRPPARQAGLPDGPDAGDGWAARASGRSDLSPRAARRSDAARASGLRDLAEDMAAILREQAIRHGIDVP